MLILLRRRCIISCCPYVCIGYDASQAAVSCILLCMYMYMYMEGDSVGDIIIAAITWWRWQATQVPRYDSQLGSKRDKVLLTCSCVSQLSFAQFAAQFETKVVRHDGTEVEKHGSSDPVRSPGPCQYYTTREERSCSLSIAPRKPCCILASAQLRDNSFIPRTRIASNYQV